MKSFLLLLSICAASLYAGPYCHVSGDDELDVVATETKNFFEDFTEELLLEGNLVDEAELQQIPVKPASLLERIAMRMKAIGIVCGLRVHYAGEWIKEKLAHMRGI